MSNLEQIKTRHRRDRWKDALFVGAAVLLLVLAIGSTTSIVIGKTSDHLGWDVMVIENPSLLSH